MSLRVIRAVAIAAIVGVVLYLVGERVFGFGSLAAASQNVLVAKSAIAIGQPLDPSQFTATTIDTSAANALGPSLYTGDPSRISGSTAAVAIQPGQPLLTTMVAGGSIGTATGASGLSSDLALYTLSSPFLSTPVYGLGQGTFVDVTATYPNRPDGQSLGSNGQLESASGLVASGLVATTMETKVQVIAVTSAPQPAVTIAIPRRDVRAFDILKRLNATFSFAEVGSKASKDFDLGGSHTISPSQIEREYNVPSR